MTQRKPNLRDQTEKIYEDLKTLRRDARKVKRRIAKEIELDRKRLGLCVTCGCSPRNQQCEDCDCHIMTFQEDRAELATYSIGEYR